MYSNERDREFFKKRREKKLGKHKTNLEKSQRVNKVFQIVKVLKASYWLTFSKKCFQRNKVPSEVEFGKNEDN